MDEKQIGNEAVVAALRSVHQDLADVQHQIGKVNFQLDLFMSGFPGGDIEGHRRYHEAMIERNAELRRLRAVILEKTIGGLIWAIIVAVGAACIIQLKLFFQGGPR